MKTKIQKPKITPVNSEGGCRWICWSSRGSFAVLHARAAGLRNHDAIVFPRLHHGLNDQQISTATSLHIASIMFASSNLLCICMMHEMNNMPQKQGWIEKCGLALWSTSIVGLGVQNCCISHFVEVSRAVFCLLRCLFTKYWWYPKKAPEWQLAVRRRSPRGRGCQWLLSNLLSLRLVGHGHLYFNVNTKTSKLKSKQQSPDLQLQTPDCSERDHVVNRVIPFQVAMMFEHFELEFFTLRFQAFFTARAPECAPGFPTLGPRVEMRQSGEA